MIGKSLNKLKTLDPRQGLITRFVIMCKFTQKFLNYKNVKIMTASFHRYVIHEEKLSVMS